MKPNNCKCGTCGKEFYKPNSDLKLGRGQFCSKPCKGVAMKRAPNRKCAVCGAPFYVKAFALKRGGNRGTYCSKACNLVGMKDATCGRCGGKYNSRRSQNGSDLCGKCHYTAKRDAKSAIRRARKLETADIAWLDPVKVFDRDGWRCKLCGVHVRRMKTYHPWRAHADHVIPLSKGGAHNMENMQTLCQSCNLSKRDSLPDDCKDKPDIAST